MGLSTGWKYAQYCSVQKSSRRSISALVDSSGDTGSKLHWSAILIVMACSRRERGHTQNNLAQVEGRSGQTKELRGKMGGPDRLSFYREEGAPVAAIAPRCTAHTLGCVGRATQVRRSLSVDAPPVLLLSGRLLQAHSYLRCE